MMNEIVQIDNSAGLVRDMSSHAVINTDSEQFNSYITQRKRMLSIAEEKANLERKIQSLEVSIAALTNTVQQLINKAQ